MHASQNQPEHSASAHISIASAEISVSEVVKRLQKGELMHFSLVDHDTDLIGEYEHDPASRKFAHSAFDTLRDLGLIEIAYRGLANSGCYATWQLAPSFRGIDLEKLYGPGFIDSLLDPETPLESSVKTAISPAGKEFASMALTTYAKQGNVAGIKRALELGADANTVVPANTSMDDNFVGASALMITCWNGPDCIEGVRALLDAGADATFRSQEGSTAMISAIAGCARYDHYAKDAEPLVDLLVAAGASPDHGFSNGKTPLFAAVNEYDGLISDTAIRALLKHGANPNAIVDYGSYKNDILTHVAWTAQQSRDEASVAAVQALVLAGAEVNPWPNPVKHFSSTPLGAVAENSARLVEFLIEHGAKVNIVNEQGETLLMSLKAKLVKYQEQGYKTDALEQIISLIENAAAKEAADGCPPHPPFSQRLRG